MPQRIPRNSGRGRVLAMGAEIASHAVRCRLVALVRRAADQASKVSSLRGDGLRLAQLILDYLSVDFVSDHR